MLSGQQINQTAETFISQMGINQKKKKLGINLLTQQLPRQEKSECW